MPFRANLRLSFSHSLFVLILLPLLLAGCADERVPEGKMKLVVWGLQYGEESKGLEARVKFYEAHHPNVKISIISMGAGGMNPQKLLTAIVGNVPPDVIYQDRFSVGDGASRDTFIPLDNYLKRDANDPNAVKPEDYYKPCWAEANYK